MRVVIVFLVLISTLFVNRTHAQQDTPDYDFIDIEPYLDVFLDLQPGVFEAITQSSLYDPYDTVYLWTYIDRNGNGQTDGPDMMEWNNYTKAELSVGVVPQTLEESFLDFNDDGVISMTDKHRMAYIMTQRGLAWEFVYSDFVVVPEFEDLDATTVDYYGETILLNRLSGGPHCVARGDADCDGDVDKDDVDKARQGFESQGPTDWSCGDWDGNGVTTREEWLETVYAYGRGRG